MNSSSSLFSHLLFFFLLILLLPNKPTAQYTNISLGTTFSPLTQPSSWPSPSGDFAFGFHALDNNPSLFLLAVWYNKIPSRTVVWTANGGSPVTKDSKALLTTDGQFYLTDATGQVIIWNTLVTNAAYAAMLDTGNFLLLAANNSVAWQTFHHPTDTILPGQVLNQQAAQLYAKLTDNDYSRGRFLLAFSDASLMLYLVAYPSEHRYGSYWSMAADSGSQLVSNDTTGGVYLSFPNGTIASIFSAPGGANYLRATLDTDGVFRQYSFPKSGGMGKGSWTVTDSRGSNVCNQNFGSGSGPCGFNSYCVPTADGKFNCRCPPNYALIDPDRTYKGCMPNFTAQSCEPGGEASFSFKMLSNVDWPLSDAEEFSPMNETACLDNCLKDCFCLVAVYNNVPDGGTCWKKKFPLSNGRSQGISRRTFVKYSMSNDSLSLGPTCSSEVNESKSDWKTWVVVVSSLLGGSVVLNFVFMGACCFVYRRRARIHTPSSGGISGATLRAFTYKELEEATKRFSEEVGKGAFGTVYKGTLPWQPRTQIAVKKLELENSMLEEAEKDFANEVTTIGQTHHKNLVRLLGFCKEGSHRLLVFEFISKGSLNKFLFGNDHPEWNKRVKIALGIAGGLTYLHEECQTQIIHCDIKPQNILLDDNFEARISDFGLAKLLRLEQTRTSTGIRGTIGYFAPEWFKNVAVTSKVDVYSFGVMLLEIICCRRNFEWRLESQEVVTVTDWAKECYRNGRLDLLVEDDEDAKIDVMRLERFVMAAISCLQDEPWLRPSMKKVVQMLEGSIAVSLPPNMF